MKRRGFTLVEMTVLVLIISITAAAVLPNVVSMQKGQRKREAYAQVLRLALRAHEEAISTGQVVEMTVNETAGQLLISRVAQTSTTSTNSPRNTLNAARPSMNSASDSDVIAQVDLGEGITFSSTQNAGQPVGSGEWKVQFYPDGKTDGGGITFTEGGTQRSLDIKPNGQIAFTEGALPQGNTEKWAAGDYERRL